MPQAVQNQGPLDAIPSASPSPFDREQTLSGTVESINRVGNRIRIRDAQNRVTEFQIDDSTVVLGNEKASSIKDVMPGERVVAYFQPNSTVLERLQLTPMAY